MTEKNLFLPRSTYRYQKHPWDRLHLFCMRMCSPIFRYSITEAVKNGSRIYDSGDYPLLNLGKGFGPVNHLAPLFLREGVNPEEGGKYCGERVPDRTSGWSYPHWEGVFYPPHLPQNKWLSYYSQFFDTVEVNSSLSSPSFHYFFQMERYHSSGVYFFR